MNGTDLANSPKNADRTTNSKENIERYRPMKLIPKAALEL